LAVLRRQPSGFRTPVAAGTGSGRVLESVVRDLVMPAGGLWALRYRVRRSAA